MRVYANLSISPEAVVARDVYIEAASSEEAKANEGKTVSDLTAPVLRAIIDRLQQELAKLS